MTGDWDDSSQEKWLADRDIELVRGQAVVREPGLVEAAGRELRYERLMIATGSVPSIPPIAGLDGVDYWTNREATSVREIPASLVVLGAGPVGCELAQFFSRMGAKVALADIADRLLPRDHPDAGALLHDVLAGEGIDIHLGCTIERVEPGIDVHLEGGTTLSGERLIVATGRRAAVEGFGFEALGLEISKRGIEVDERMRAGDGVWAVRRRDRHRHVHARRQVPGARGRGRRGRKAGPRRPPRRPGRHLHRPAGRLGRHARPATGSSWASAAARPASRPTSARSARASSRCSPTRERRVLVGACAVGPEAGEWLAS